MLEILSFLKNIFYVYFLVVAYHQYHLYMWLSACHVMLYFSSFPVSTVIMRHWFKNLSRRCYYLNYKSDNVSCVSYPLIGGWVCLLVCDWLVTVMTDPQSPEPGLSEGLTEQQEAVLSHAQGRPQPATSHNTWSLCYVMYQGFDDLPWDSFVYQTNHQTLGLSLSYNLVT